MTPSVKNKTLFVVNLLLSIFTVVITIMADTYVLLWYTLVAYLIVSWFGAAVSYHRFVTHSSFTVHRPIKLTLLYIGALTCLPPPITTAFIHRAHHKFSDTEDDPHSPYHISKFWLSIGFKWKDIKENPRSIIDLLRDKDMVFFERHHYLIIFSWVCFLFIIDPLAVLYVYALPATLIWFATHIAIWQGHGTGYRNYETSDNSVNSVFVFLMLGEGWQNNHHNTPKAWSNWEKWWEIDIPSIIIWLIKLRKTKDENKSSKS
jgi:fatty-acid desaturase